jgi:hypothetical protein
MRNTIAVVVLALAACAHESKPAPTTARVQPPAPPAPAGAVSVERQPVAGHDEPVVPELDQTQTQLVDGLATLAPKPEDRWQIADIHDVLDDGRIRTLDQAVAARRDAKETADEVTKLLRNAGLLQPNERIVGIGGRLLYKLAE